MSVSFGLKRENAAGGTLRMTSRGASIDDMDWRAVSFVYDSTSDLARIYVDGVVVAESAFSGDTPPPGHGFFIGDPWGSSFNRQLRSIEVRGDERAAGAACGPALWRGL